MYKSLVYRHTDKNVTLVPVTLFQTLEKDRHTHMEGQTVATKFIISHLQIGSVYIIYIMLLWSEDYTRPNIPCAVLLVLSTKI